MSNTIGQQLATARQARRLSIEDVAHQTRIHHGVVRQLEADDYASIPNMMFVKSFLNLYSRHLEIDIRVAITQLSAPTAKPHREQYLLGSIKPSVRGKYGHLTSRIRLRPLLASAAALVLLAIGASYLVSHLYGSNANTSTTAGQAAQPKREHPKATSENPASTRPESDKEIVIQPDKSMLPITVPASPTRPAAEVPEELAEIDMSEIPRAIPKAKEPPKALPNAPPNDDLTTATDGQPFEVSLPVIETGEERNEQDRNALVETREEEPEEEFLDPGIVEE